jgi:acyl carrier protein
MTPKTQSDLKSTVLLTLAQIAPEADLEKIDPDLSFREQLDLDSMDLLNFVVSLHNALGVDIPEADYPQLASLNASLRYLSEKVRHTKQSGVGSQNG